MQIAQIGESILRKPARQVLEEEFNQSDLINFTDNLLGTMLRANGIGIAAPQVSDPRSIMYVASRANERYPDAPSMEPLLLINPTIINKSSILVSQWEGCLSVPGLRGNITRSNAVNVRYQTIEGTFLERNFEGFLARIFLHEYDHLIGKTWLDHVTDSKQIMSNEVWLKAFEQNSL